MNTKHSIFRVILIIFILWFEQVTLSYAQCTTEFTGVWEGKFTKDKGSKVVTSNVTLTFTGVGRDNNHLTCRFKYYNISTGEKDLSLPFEVECGVFAGDNAPFFSYTGEINLKHRAKTCAGTFTYKLTSDSVTNQLIGEFFPADTKYIGEHDEFNITVYKKVIAPTLRSTCPDFPNLVHNYAPSNLPAHEYFVCDTVICPVDNPKHFDREAIFNIMLSNRGFSAPTILANEPVEECKRYVLLAPGNIYTEMGLAAVFGAGYTITQLEVISPIVSVVDKTNFAITNYTLPGHPLHDGFVTRTVVVEDGWYKIRTVGKGVNVTAMGHWVNTNSWLMHHLWGRCDHLLKEEVLRQMLPEPVLIASHSTITNEDSYADAYSPKVKPLGGKTPDELGRLLLRAIVTNSQALWDRCRTPEDAYPPDELETAAERKVRLAREERVVERSREQFEEHGVSDFKLVKFSRVIYQKKLLSDPEYMQLTGETMGEYFILEFTYGTNFVGQMDGMTIMTYKKGNYFLSHMVLSDVRMMHK